MSVKCLKAKVQESEKIKHAAKSWLLEKSSRLLGTGKAAVAERVFAE